MEKRLITEIVEEPGLKTIHTKEVTVHHRDCSQVSNSEDTATASETEDTITPGQGSKPPGEDTQHSVFHEEGAATGEDLHMEVGGQDQSNPSPAFEGFSFWDVITGGGNSSEKRSQHFSTDDEAENSVSSQVGSIVNSVLGLATESTKSKVKKVKNS